MYYDHLVDGALENIFARVVDASGGVLDVRDRGIEIQIATVSFRRKWRRER